MIPLKDTIPSKRVPFVTWLIIVINILVFCWELTLGPRLESSLLAYSFQPARFFGHDPHHIDAASRFLPLLTSMFLHGGWLHLLGNMLFLFVFGDNVEDSFGHGPYVVFYVFCGAVSAITQAMAVPLSHLPMVGASGAIAGVLGAYFVLFPHGRVLTLIPIFIFFQIVEIPAFFFLLYWFLLQFLAGTLFAGSAEAASGGVAWWAHIGGFATGLLISMIVRVSRAFR
jgi:hypothetical protein